MSSLTITMAMHTTHMLVTTKIIMSVYETNFKAQYQTVMCHTEQKKFNESLSEISKI